MGAGDLAEHQSEGNTCYCCSIRKVVHARVLVKTTEPVARPSADQMSVEHSFAAVL